MKFNDLYVNSQIHIEIVFIFISFFLFNCLLLWPLPLHLHTHVLTRAPDLFGTLNYYWLISDQLINHRFSLKSDYLFFPFGWEPFASNACYTDAFVGGAITTVASPIIAYNILSLLIPPLNALSLWWFLRKRNISLESIIPGALWFGFNPFVINELHQGRISQAIVFFLPLYFHWLLKALNKASLSAWLFSGILLSCISISYFYYGVMTIIASIFIYSLHMAQFKSLHFLLKQLFYTFLAFLLSLLIITPFLLPNLVSTNMPIQSFDFSMNPEFSALAEHLRISNSLQVGLQSASQQTRGARLPYPLLILLALIFLSKRSIRFRSAWLMLAFIFILAAIGPQISLNDSHLLRNPVFTYLNYAIPFFSRFWWPLRFLCIVHLCFGLIISLNLEHLYLRLVRYPIAQVFISRLIWVVLTTSIIVSDSRPTRLSRLQIPNAYTWLSDQDKGAVIELPVSLTKSYSALFYQTIHKKPLLLGSEVPPVVQPQQFSTFVKDTPFFKWLEQEKKNRSQTALTQFTREMRDTITALGFRYLVLNPEFFVTDQLSRPDEYETLLENLRMYLTEYHEFSNGIFIFELK